MDTDTDTKHTHTEAHTRLSAYPIADCAYSIPPQIPSIFLIDLKDFSEASNRLAASRFPLKTEYRMRGRKKIGDRKNMDCFKWPSRKDFLTEAGL